MQLHDLKPKHKRTSKKRVGRGGKRGTYSGRGLKGQKSRSGGQFQPVIRELIKRYPKLRGYRRKAKTQNSKPEIIILNVEILEKKFKKDEKITPELLLKQKIISRIKGKMPLIKILGRGKITKSLTIENCEISKSAKEKIEKAGGEVKIKK